MMKTSDLIWQDTQHQLLFQLIDEIKTDPFDRSVLNKLCLYAEHHFSLEEAYMLQLNYPEREAHLLAHNKFREELRQMLEKPTQLDDQIRHSLSLYLSEWLKRHVLGIDKQFEAFVLNSSAK